MKEVYIISAVRTPLGSFGGSLASVPATKLGAIAINGAVIKAGFDRKEVQEVYMGSVLQANLGQAPARQASKYAGLADNVQCTTINKVCASGMKAVMVGAQSIMCGDADVVVAGGMENMSQVPFYSENMRWGNKYGNVTMIDGLSKDGLIDCYHNYPMGKLRTNSSLSFMKSRTVLPSPGSMKFISRLYLLTASVKKVVKPVSRLNLAIFLSLEL